MKFQHDNSGFSLAEMLVAVGVFAVTMAVASAIFINVNNLQQQTSNMAKLQNEGRYLLEKMTKEIRGRELDYNEMAIDPQSGVADVLIFKPDEFGEILRLRYDSAGLAVAIESGLKSAGLSSSEISVADLKFKISPIDDPYDVFSAQAPIEQPRVTVMMLIANRGVPERFKKTLLLQTTVSSKTYR